MGTLAGVEAPGGQPGLPTKLKSQGNYTMQNGSSQPRFQITIDRIKPIQKKGLLGFVDVTIGGRLRINDVKLLAYPGQPVQLALPQKSYQQDGQEHFKDIVVIPDEDLLRCITEAVVTAWETNQRKGPWNLAM